MADTSSTNAASPTTTESPRGLKTSRYDGGGGSKPSRASWRALVGDRPRQTVMRIVAMVVTAYVVFGYFLLPVRGEGPSMLPTMSDGQLVFVNTLAYWRGEPRRGDIVALSLAGRRVVYVKRIIGLPGERLRIASGTVFINDNPLVEPYVVRRATWNVPEILLGPGEYFVIGDNRGMSSRQHDFGRARRERIIGRVVTAP